MGAKGFVGFVPWIIFWVVSSPSTWGYAAGAALLAGLILLIPSSERGHVKLLDVVSVLFFGALTIAALFLDRSQLRWLEDYAQAISSGVLAVVVLGSLAFMPFTEQYAREQAPPEAWASPPFRQINRVLTLVWGLVFAACAILGVISQHVHSGTVWLNWIIPIGLVIGGLKFSERYPDQARAAAGMPARASSEPSFQHRT